MEQQTHVRLRTNEANMFKNFGQLFSNKQKVLSELLQNARRAGATQVDITIDNHTLTFEDDGIGIDDFQTLMCAFESGWNADVVAAENPFGLGWFSTLFAATRVQISSNAKECDINSADALDMEPIAVNTTGYSGPTRITLHDFTLSEEVTRMSLANLVMGFPIPVTVNGEMLFRPHAIGHIDAVKTDVGLVSIAGKSGRKNYTAVSVIYFQGMAVSTPYEFFNLSAHEPFNIVHLDDTFKLRMPDRDCLIDPKESVARIQKALANWWKKHLHQLKTTLTPSDFFSWSNEAIAVGEAQLLNDVPYLPSCVVRTLMDYPTLNNQYKSSFVDREHRRQQLQLTKEDLENGNRIVVTNFEQVEFEYSMAVATAIHKQHWVVYDGRLHRDHWIHAYLVDLADKPVRVERVVKSTCEEYFSFNATIEVVDHFTIHIGEYAFTYDDVSIACGQSDEGEEATLIIAGDPGDILQQAYRFETDDQFDEDWCANETYSLCSLVAIMRGENPADTFWKVLATAGIQNEKANCVDTAIVSLCRSNRLTCLALEDVLRQFCHSMKIHPDEAVIAAFINQKKPTEDNFGNGKKVKAE